VYVGRVLCEWAGVVVGVWRIVREVDVPLMRSGYAVPGAVGCCR
jgi:hypothetical protein